MTCTFFGHRDTPESIQYPLHDIILNLIEQNGVTDFLIGSQGAFDATVIRVLHQLQTDHPHIRITVVLAYRPVIRDTLSVEPHETIFPESVAKAPRTYAIVKRNEWMLKQANYVIAYVTHPFGGAASFYERAKKDPTKTVINLADVHD